MKIYQSSDVVGRGGAFPGKVVRVVNGNANKSSAAAADVAVVRSLIESISTQSSSSGEVR